MRDAVEHAERARVEPLEHQRLRGVVLDDTGTLPSRARISGGSSSRAPTAIRSNSSGGSRGLGPSLRRVQAQGREPLLDHALGVALLLAGDAEQVARVGLVERVEPRAGEQLAQQARRLGGLAEVDVDLGRSQPGLGVVGVGLAPAAVGLERGLRVVLLARQRRFELDHGRVVGGGFSRRAQRALHGAQVAVFERLPGVVEEALQFGIVCGLVGHGATVPRAGTAAQREQAASPASGPEDPRIGSG